MIKIEDLVYHWQSSDKVGKVIHIEKSAINHMTVGGTLESRTYAIIEYLDGSRRKYLTSELHKHYS